MLARKHFVVGSVRFATFALVLVLGLTGCVSSMVSPKEELQSLGENEGIVFGSFVINVEQGEENESGWDFLKGPKSGDFKYRVTIAEKLDGAAYFASALVPVRRLYTFDVKPGQEFTFIKKLPAGPYWVATVERLGLHLGVNALVSLGVDFTVRPKQTTYIGRLTVQLPHRGMRASTGITTGKVSVRVSTMVADAQEETINSLRKEHGDFAFSSVVKEFQGSIENYTITLVHPDTGRQAVCASPKSSQEATALMQGLPQPLVYTGYMALLADLNARRISVVQYCAKRYELANYVRSSSPLEPAKGATYTDTTFRWSVTYPDFWRLDGSEPRAVMLKRGMAVVGIYPKEIAGESLDEVVDAALQRWEQNIGKGKGFEVISRRRVTLSNNLPAIEVVHHIGRGVVGKSRKVYAVVKDRGFYIDAETYLEAWPMFESDFNRIVESLVVRD